MPELTPTDEALMIAYQKGDAAAFSQLLRRYEGRMFTFFLRSAGRRDLAEELFQELFMRVIRAAASYEAQAKFSTWLYTMARHLSIDHARRQKFRQTQSLDSVESTTAAPSNQVPSDDFDTRRHLEKALLRLPEEQREVFLMREVGELSFVEIAEVSGVPLGTVKSRMRYALVALREALSVEYGEGRGEAL